MLQFLEKYEDLLYTITEKDDTRTPGLGALERPGKGEIFDFKKICEFTPIEYPDGSNANRVS